MIFYGGLEDKQCVDFDFIEGFYIVYGGVCQQNVVYYCEFGY